MRRMPKASVLLLCALFGAACGLVSGPNVESETHFLRLCNDDCGSGLECVCGVCTQRCDDVGACAELAEGAQCLVSVGMCADARTICDVECSRAEDCEDLGIQAWCENGRCRGPEAPNDEVAPLNSPLGIGALATKRTRGGSESEVLKPQLEVLEGDPIDEPFVNEEGRASCGDTLVRDTYAPTNAVLEEAADILEEMNLDQKVVQLTGTKPPPAPYAQEVWETVQSARDDEELNLRGFKWKDGPDGLDLDPGKIPSGLENYATAFPTGSAQGATFDRDLIYRVGEALGDQTLAVGAAVVMAPAMNILRHPRWGRSQETFGEDSFHLGRMATALTQGIQEYTLSCAKHFTAYNVEEDRFDANANMDEQTLREVHGRHFEMVVRDGGVACMMASYNKVQGTKSTQNRHTLTEMLREDMGFRGFVVSDWWAMPGANTGKGPVEAPNDLATATEAVAAGLDLEMPWALNFGAIPEAVEQGDLEEEDVDRAVLRVLEQKLRFSSAYLDADPGLREPVTEFDEDSGSIVQSEEHSDLAQEVAERAMVLLKNENSALPLVNPTKVAVLGARVDYTVSSDPEPEGTFDFAQDAALGDHGSGRVFADPDVLVGPFTGILGAAPQGVEVITGDSVAVVTDDVDAVVVVVGLTPGDEGEEWTGAGDRETLELSDEQNELVRRAIGLERPVIVVVEAGSVVEMPWIGDVDAAIMAWYPGEKGGAALGRLLFGQVNFAGRLPVTWPQSEDQLPTFGDGETEEMDYYVGYRRFDRMNLSPLYAFGHGLSYSEFTFERLHIPCAEVSEESVIQVEVDVRNTSEVAGDEAVFVFASHPDTEARRSVKELKGFARVQLDAGEAKRVTIPVRMQDLKYWDDSSDTWVVEKGPVLLSVGPSSDQLVLEQTVTVN